MDKETFESHQAFAGTKRPSMQRRCVGFDYHGRQMYMLTMVVEGRHPLFGRLVGRSNAEPGAADVPRMELSELGRRVEREWWGISNYYPQIEVVALQMMPDHLHGILFVRERMKVDLSRVVRGFKTGCNRAFREVVLGRGVATQSQHTGQTGPAGEQAGKVGEQAGSVGLQVDNAGSVGLQVEQAGKAGEQAGKAVQAGSIRLQAGRTKEDREHGLLFERGFNDKLLLRSGQLERWINYLHDNPRRLLMKREHPDLFRVQRGLQVAGLEFSAIGNRFLLDRPELVQVQCSRRLTETEIATEVARCLRLAGSGAVLVSPAISPGEKAVMRAAFEAGWPLIFLQENGFTELAKLGGRRMEACARGQLLILAPWEHHNEQLTIQRSQCLQLNEMARLICEGKGGATQSQHTGQAGLQKGHLPIINEDSE